MKKRTKWFLIATVSVVLILAITGGVLLYLLTRPGDDEDIDINHERFSHLLEAPEGVEAMAAFDIPTDDAELIQKAVDLYFLANENDKNAEMRVFYGYCPTSNIIGKMENKVDIDQVFMKNGDQNFRIEYRLKNNIPLFNTFPEEKINQLVELVITERRYYNLEMEKEKYQRVTNASLDENNIPYANWETIKETSDTDIPIFNKAQDGVYEKCEHTINYETVTAASIEYNAEGKYYEVRMTLDVDNPVTTKNKMEAIVAGTQDKNAKFAELEVMFQIWDSGYYRYFEYKEHWSAKAFNLSFLTVASDFLYQDKYSYHPDDCNIDDYKDAVDMKTAFGW